MYDFDEIIDRSSTDCIKYDCRESVFGRKDVIPMWVADMDFRTPPFVLRAINEKVEQGILGYSFRPEGYFTSLMKWVKHRHGWEISREWIEFSPGVVPALNMCTLAFTDPDDEIIIQPPVYTPFFGAINDHGRKPVLNNLVETSQGWRMDIEDLKKKITPSTRMIILSNPHNPVGRAWSRDELSAVADLCYGKNIVVLSDEIHSDLMLPGNKHVPFASVSPEAAAMTVTCMAPSKTFNLAGLSTSSVIISNDILREKYHKTLEGLHMHLGNIFGNVASETAYTYGEGWLKELLSYVKENVDLVMSFCKTNIPVIKPVMPEATYMIWLDCRALRMSGRELHRFFVEKAGVGMNEGSAFGPGGEGFMRLNLACPRATVQKALEQIEEAIKTLNL
ncbi:MAG TPA: PatB family C-S lyase [Bacteroidales bacterium]|nr:PatB family C-S lyase [Bacteroidales bacterium]